MIWRRLPLESKFRRATTASVVILALFAGGVAWNTISSVTFRHSTCAGTNTIRAILRTQLGQEINQSLALERSGRYAAFFPSIPAAELHALLAKQRRRERAEIAQLADETC